MIKNMKLVELHTKYATVFLNTQTLKLIEDKCLCYGKNNQQKFDEKLKE